MITPEIIQINSVVTAIRENVMARLQNGDFCHVHPDHRLLVIAVGTGNAICRKAEDPKAPLMIVPTSDLEVQP